MGKIYAAVYSDTAPGVAAGAPKSGCSAAISISANKLKCIKVPLASEGYLKQLVVKQSSGTAYAFAVDVLMSVIPFAEGEAANNATASGTLELYQVFPTISVSAAGTLQLVPDSEMGYPFRNLDGDHTLNQRFLYLVIRPSSNSGSSTWDALLMVEGGQS